MKNEYIVIRSSARDSKEAILLCADALNAAGYVSKEFGKLCVEREKEYPTGLPTEIPTAIPHAKDGNEKLSSSYRRESIDYGGNHKSDTKYGFQAE